MESGSDKEIQHLTSMLDQSELAELLQQLPPHHWRRLLGFIAPNDLATLILQQPEAEKRELLHFFHPSDLASLLTALDEEEWGPLVEQLEAEQLSALLTELEDPELHQMVPRIQKQLPALISEMDSDDAADILGELPEEWVEQILQEMPQEESDPLEQLLQYEEDTAGGLMQTELIRVPVDATAAEAIEEIRRQVDKEEGDLDIYQVYVVDDQGRLEGHFALDRLILADPSTLSSALVEPEFYYVTTNLDQEEVADYFQRYDLISLPVVDQERRLLGRITVDDIVDVMKEEASEDILQMAGVGGSDMVYDRILQSTALRLPWLFTNLFGGLLTGYLMWAFKWSLGDKLLVVLVGFVPVITGMGGNVGTQSSSITVRGFAINRIESANYTRYLFKEMRVGALLGVCCGLILSLVGWIWHGQAMLGVCVGLALFLAMTLAATLGAFFPALFEKLNIDPALASGPFVTTFNDVSGILIYFGMAFMFRSMLIS
jgi:magnesium transporter